jgi:hypothetical protein
LSNIILSDYDAVDFVLDLVHSLGEYFEADDIADYPWDPMRGGPGHVAGMPHHGMIGYWMKTIAFLAKMGKVGLAMAEEFRAEEQNKSLFQEMMERWEKIAYPEIPLMQEEVIFVK